LWPTHFLDPSRNAKGASLEKLSQGITTKLTILEVGPPKRERALLLHLLTPTHLKTYFYLIFLDARVLVASGRAAIAD
jgi:hypothetical protein